MRAVVFILALVAASAIQVDFSDDAWEKPIQKVIRLLNEMSTQLQKEADEDEDIMDKLGCWCDTNEKAKSHANAVNGQRLTDLGAAIEEYTAKKAQLAVDIENLKTEVADKTKSLEEATALREKDAAEFFAEEKDSIVNIGATKGAILTLGKVMGSALNQESLAQVKDILRHQHKEHRSLFSTLSAKQHRVVLSLLQETPTATVKSVLLQAQNEAAAEGQAPQSGAIFGILKQMKESMETNLAQAQKDEETAKAEFADMKASKTEEINAAEELIDSKTVELATTGENLASSKQDSEDTTATVAADTEFLANLKKKCDNASAEYMARSKVRNEEIQAVTDTIGILTEDDAKDLMMKGFIQVSSQRTRTTSRERAARFVQRAAQKLNRPKLATLAVSMRADVFAKVKENIDAMVVGLKQEQKDEVKQKDFCIEELHQNEMMTAEKNDKREDLTNFIADFETMKSQLADAIAGVKAEIDATHVAMKQASELRQKENGEFQMTVTDQRATQKILAKALDRLKSFYAKKGFLQIKQQTKANQPGYKKNAGASSVMAMIEGVISESKEEEKQALTAENDSQSAYETYIGDSNASLDALSKDLVNKSEELATADEKKVKAEGDLRITNEELLKLAEYDMNLHTQCDFLTKNFNLRQTKRSEEIEALQQAKAIFSGANFGL